MAASVFGRSLSGHGRLTLFRTPAPGAHSLDGRNPAISTSAGFRKNHSRTRLVKAQAGRRALLNRGLLKRFNNAREPFGPHSVDRLEDLLGLSADGANPPVGQLLERGAGSDAVIGVAERRVVNVFADGATIFFHVDKRLVRPDLNK